MKETRLSNRLVEYMQTLSMKGIPKLPKGKKVIAKYYSNEYLNVLCIDKDFVEFFLWDGISESFNHIIRFAKIK